MNNNRNDKLSISVASLSDIDSVYALRHEVYATELGQYKKNKNKSLIDNDQVKSTYILAHQKKKLVGFVAVTSPNSPKFSFEVSLPKTELPFGLDSTYEIRALTVKQSSRGEKIANYLMYSAFRWIQSHGGERIISMGRIDVLDIYLRLGMRRYEKNFKAGEVTYELIGAKVSEISSHITSIDSQIKQMEMMVDWKMDFSFSQPSECYHGGAFFDAIGNRFDDLSRISNVINADVLDAWFDPAPEVQDMITNELAWTMKTSPPTRAEGLIEAIAEKRNVSNSSILPGAGSSDLIFLAFCHWLKPTSKVLILDPTYGEYSHIIEQIIKCQVERFELKREEGYKIDLDYLATKLDQKFDLFIWVNPNSPTGLHVKREDIESLLKKQSGCKRIWIDETYIEYIGKEQSLESFAARSTNIIVCKSMSKVYALSGLRSAYLCGSPHQLEDLKVLTPPWSISLPAQIAATYALESDSYYMEKYQETHNLKNELVAKLKDIGINEIIPGVANFIMFHLPNDFKSVSSIISECRKKGLYLRDVSGMGTSIGTNAMRMAVKDSATNKRMMEIFTTAVN